MTKSLSQLRAKRAKGDNGFTLIELLVVVVILGVLIAIAIPLYLNYRKGANDSAAQSDIRNAIGVLEQCNAENSAYPTPAGTITMSTPGALGSGCTGQTISLSNGTTLYYTKTGTPTGSGYIIVDTNANGSGKFWCYNSTKGGSVAAVAGPASSATC